MSSNRTAPWTPRAKLIACLLANCGILAVTVTLVTVFADHSPYWRFGYNPDLVVVSVRIDTLERYIALLSVIGFIHASRVVVEEVGMPILGFTIYNPDKKHVEEFSKNELQFFANAMFMVSGLRSIFMMVVSISQIDLAIWSLIVSEFTSLFTIRMLLNEKTFGPPALPPQEERGRSCCSRQRRGQLGPKGYTAITPAQSTGDDPTPHGAVAEKIETDREEESV